MLFRSRSLEYPVKEIYYGNTSQQEATPALIKINHQSISSLHFMVYEVEKEREDEILIDVQILVSRKNDGTFRITFRRR